MAALPTDFLKEVIAEVARIKGIEDANKVVKEADPTVTSCARLAYVQICKKVRRPFHYGQRTEYYDEYTGPLLLRSIPIDRDKPFRVVVDGDEFTEDIKIARGKLILGNVTNENIGYALYKNIELTLWSGIKLIEDNTILFTATQLQTIANYHRRDSYGLTQTSGEKGIAKTPADSGQIIESVEQLLDELIYNGIGYSMDGE